MKFAILGSLKPEKGQDIVFPLAKRFPEIDFYLIGKESKENKEWIESTRLRMHEENEIKRRIIDPLKNSTATLILNVSVLAIQLHVG